MRHRFGLLAVLVLLIGPACDASGPTGPDPAPVRTVYGPSGLNTALSLTPLPDGSLVVAGYADGALGPADGLDSRPLLLRVGPDGAVASATVYRDLRYGAAYGAVPFGNGLAVLAKGEREENDAPGRDGAVYRTTPTGTRAGVLVEEADPTFLRRVLARTADGDLLFARGPSDTLVKLGRGGTPAWTYALPEGQAVTGVAEAQDRALWVLSRRDARRFALIRLTPNGREQGRRTYGADTLRRATGLAAVGDGAAVLQARSVPETTRETVVVTRVDGAGAVRWRRDYATGELRTASITALPEDGLAFGYTEQVRQAGDGHGRQRATVVRLAPDGSVRERRRFGPPEKAAHVSVVAARPNGALIAAGSVGPTDTRYRSQLLVEQYRSE